MWEVLNMAVNKGNGSSRINTLYKYKFNEIYLIHGTEVLQLNFGNVISFRIHKDYDGFIRSEYILTLQIDNKTNIWMSRYQNDFQVYLDIQKILTDDNGDQIGPNMQFIKSTFIAFNPTTSSLSIDRLQDSTGNIYQPEQNNDLAEFMSQASVTIGLIQQDMFNKSMSPCNTIVTKDNLQNIVLSMLTKAGFKKVLMSPFQNYNTYEDMIIPPVPLYRAIQYLDNKYGFYKAGAVVFYDYNTVYVIDSSMKNPVYPKRDNPYSVLHIYESSKNDIGGHVTNASGRELFVANSVANIVYGEDFHTSVGSTTTISDPKTGEKVAITYPSTLTNELESSNVVFCSTETAEFIYQRQLENTIRILISGYHYDADAFQPNIVTSVYHSNAYLQKRINGKYRIVNVDITIYNQGDNFVSNTGVTYAYCGK